MSAPPSRLRCLIFPTLLSATLVGSGGPRRKAALWIFPDRPGGGPGCFLKLQFAGLGGVTLRPAPFCRWAGRSRSRGDAWDIRHLQRCHWHGKQVCGKSQDEEKERVGLGMSWWEHEEASWDGQSVGQLCGFTRPSLGSATLNLLPRRRKMEAESLVSVLIDSFGIWREAGTRPGYVGARQFIKNRPIDDLI